MAKAHPGAYRVSECKLTDTATAMAKYRCWKVPTLKQTRPNVTAANGDLFASAFVPITFSPSITIPDFFSGTDALKERLQFLDHFFESQTAVGTWRYSPEGMVKLLQCFRTLPVKDRRGLFDALSIEWAVTSALWCHFRITEQLTEDSYWTLFSTWMKRPSYLLVRGSSSEDHEFRQPRIRAQQMVKPQPRLSYRYKPTWKDRQHWLARIGSVIFERYCILDITPSTWRDV